MDLKKWNKRKERVSKQQKKAEKAYQKKKDNAKKVLKSAKSTPAQIKKALSELSESDVRALKMEIKGESKEEPDKSESEEPETSGAGSE